MASLEVKRFAGAFSGTDLSIPDGPPTASKQIPAGGSGAVYGADMAPAICILSPIGGSVTLSWTVGSDTVTEVLSAPEARALRGETVGVA